MIRFERPTWWHNSFPASCARIKDARTRSVGLALCRAIAKWLDGAPWRSDQTLRRCARLKGKVIGETFGTALGVLLRKGAISDELTLSLYEIASPSMRAWMVRCLCKPRQRRRSLRLSILRKASTDPSAEVRESCVYASLGYPARDVLSFIEDMSKSDRSKDVRYWATHHLPLIRDGWYTDGRTCGDATSLTVLIDGQDGLSICSSWPTKIEIDAAGGIAQWAAYRRTGVELEEASTESGDLEWAAELFAEYADSIADIAGPSLQHQGFASELSSLPGAYGRPRGCIFLAIVNYRPVGCIALRPLPALGPDVCELKRMYVRPKFRKRGIARVLAKRLIAEARAIGYRVMKLDTSSSMHAAIALYRSLGFVPCERYNDDPMTDTLWFELKL